MLRAFDSLRRPVKARHALLLAASLAACSTPYTPVSKGATGYLSDQAWELDVELHGTVHAPSSGPAYASPARDARIDALIWAELLRQTELAGQQGARLFAERAFVHLSDDRDRRAPDGVVSWEARLQTLATLWEVPQGPEVYGQGVGVTFHGPPAEAFAARPDYAALAADGQLTVGVLFGQMDTQQLLPDDDGYWSRDAFLEDLSLHGYTVSKTEGPWTRLEKQVGTLSVSIDVAGPDAFRLGEDEREARVTVQRLLAGHELSYVNGHSNQRSLDAIGARESYVPERYRVLVLDLCWAYYLYARPALDAAPWGRTHVVNAANRVVTGSVESFSLLLHAAVRGAAYPEQEAPGWLQLVQGMNELAEARASERRGRVQPLLEPAELYGVSGVWRPAPLNRSSSR